MGCTASVPLNVEKERYDNIRDRLKTGDILLCSGKGRFSCMVKCFTCSPWSHVGMVIRLDTSKKARERESKDNNNAYRGPLKVESEDGLYLWHSMNESTGGMVDCITGKPKKGPQLNCLKNVISRYNGYLYIRLMLREIPIENKIRKIKQKYSIEESIGPSIGKEEEDEEDDDNSNCECDNECECDDTGRNLINSDSNNHQENRSSSSSLLVNRIIKVPNLTSHFTECVKKDYEDDVSELFKSAYDGPLGSNSDNFDTYFCSELVAHTYKMLGFIIKTNVPSNEYTPDDFYSTDCLVGLKKGLRLSKEIRIVK